MEVSDCNLWMQFKSKNKQILVIFTTTKLNFAVVVAESHLQHTLWAPGIFV